MVAKRLDVFTRNPAGAENRYSVFLSHGRASMIPSPTWSVGYERPEHLSSSRLMVLDAQRATTLRAWVTTLIPARGDRPDAADVGAAEYVDATVFLVPALRPALIQAIDRLERSANDQRHKAFSECSAEDREGLLREFEAVDASDAFNMVRDFTYEAYYGHSRVLAALEKETSWSSASPTRGSAMKPFDASRLERVSKLPPRWRKA
ncbi:MAG: gluconate 2-dehydrogenase subunit 3 family protein [Chloroflexi bacterium]|nr:MAG: gluconate 2-dehydrogenase subunit 3 family protein [Chloroflexota bacterium]